jgi:hypothetical protein
VAHDDDEPELHSKRHATPHARCPRHQDKDYRRLVNAAWAAGWWCERGKNNYIKCYAPNDRGVVSVPSTPRKQGTIHIVARKFRKLGLDV